MILTVGYHKTEFKDAPHRFEAGTPDISGPIGLHAAMDYLDAIGRENIWKHDQELANYAAEKLSALKNIRIFGPKQNRAGLVSFLLKDVHAHDVVTLATGRTALDAVADRARRDGWNVLDLGHALTGEARAVGAAHAVLAQDLVGKPGRHLVLSGGELTVTSAGTQGCGGPNLEYLAGLAQVLRPGDPICALAGDSDGIDGTEDNAGGFVTAGAIPAEALRAALASHRTHTLFQAHGGLIITGPSLTNVNDIRMIAVEPR